MKSLVLIVLISLTAIAASVSQTSVYHPLPEGDAYWRESSEGYQCCCADYQYVLKGDTAIGGIDYQKVEQSGVTYDLNPGGGCIHGGYSYFFKQYKGAVRNDIPGKKVWFVPADSTTEQLLYNFDMELYDTLMPSYLYNQNWAGTDYYIYVASVDSVRVGNNYHKRFGIATTYNLQNVYAELIEGVGSSFGLFGSLGVLWPPFEFGSMLECLNIEGITVLPDYSTSCLLITGIDKPVKQENFGIYPNPVGETAVIIIPAHIQQVDLQIFDVSGREVYAKNGVSRNTVFLKGNLPKGVYFYQFSIKRSVQSYGKLVVN